MARMKSNLPDEMVHTDDCDFIPEVKRKKDRVYQKSMAILKNKHLLVDEDKTENKTIKRKEVETEEEWRNVIKLGSKLGDWENTKRRKELSNIALSNNETVWKKKWKTKLKTRLRLYESLVKSILFYKCGTWGLS